MSMDVHVHDVLRRGIRVWSRIPHMRGRVVHTIVSVRGTEVLIRARDGSRRWHSFDEYPDCALQMRPGGLVAHVVGVRRATRGTRGFPR